MQYHRTFFSLNGQEGCPSLYWEVIHVMRKYWKQIWLGKIIDWLCTYIGKNGLGFMKQYLTEGDPCPIHIHLYIPWRGRPEAHSQRAGAACYQRQRAGAACYQPKVLANKYNGCNAHKHAHRHWTAHVENGQLSFFFFQAMKKHIYILHAVMVRVT